MLKINEIPKRAKTTNIIKDIFPLIVFIAKEFPP